MTRGMDLWSTLVGFRQLCRLFREREFDIVQYCTPKAALLSSLAGFISRIPVRLYCQWGIRYVGVKGPLRKVLRLLEKITCLLSTDIAPDSRGNLEFAIAEGLYARDKGRVVHNGSANGVNLGKFDIARKAFWREHKRAEIGLNEDGFVYGFVGRITREKGINELVRAFLRLAQNDSGACLLLIGPEEEDHGLSLEVIQSIHHHPQIIAVGRKANPQEYVAAMDVVVLPSYREGFGTVAIEAQAMGVPVITTDIPGPREAIIDGETGMLVPAVDEESLVVAMSKLGNDRGLLRSMGDKATLFVRENFEQGLFWEKMLEHRRSLLDRAMRR